MRIIHYIIFCAFLLNACNDNQTNEAVTISENFELQNKEDKNLIEVIDKSPLLHPVNKILTHADAGGDIIVDVNKTFKLDASASTGDIVGYEWKYKGDIFSDTPITNLKIKQTGSFEITLEITDSNGEVSKDTKIIDVMSGEKVNKEGYEI